MRPAAPQKANGARRSRVLAGRRADRRRAAGSAAGAGAIAAEEAARAELGTLPRLRAEADGCARRLAVFTQTLKTLRAIPAAAPPAPDYDSPQNIDEFRETFARRIQAFIQQAVGTERYAMARQIRDLTDDELSELIHFGRERGMECCCGHRQTRRNTQIEPALADCVSRMRSSMSATNTNGSVF
ncbi:MAG: hypothetical protein P8Y53_02785 [Pseudolabrys sp.]